MSLPILSAKFFQAFCALWCLTLNDEDEIRFSICGSRNDYFSTSMDLSFGFSSLFDSFWTGRRPSWRLPGIRNVGLFFLYYFYIWFTPPGARCKEIPEAEREIFKVDLPVSIVIKISKDYVTVTLNKVSAIINISIQIFSLFLFRSREEYCFNPANKSVL